MKLFRFHVLLSVRSMRVVAPTAVAAVWIALIMAFPGTATAAGAAVFMAYLVYGCWMTVVLGNIDDDPHRYVMTCAAGTRSKLHTLRALVALVYVVALAAATSALIVLSVMPKHDVLQTLAALFAVGVSGGLIGVAVGTFLHRPVVFNIAATVLVAVLALVAVVAFPPLQHLLRDFGNGRIVLSLPLLATSLVLASAGVASAAAIAQVRSR